MAAPSEIRVFGLGDQGVHVSVGPLHSEIGDVTSAQNASFLSAGARGGLASRPGLAKYSALCAGAILSILSVTFPDTAATTILTDMDLVTVTDNDGIALVEG